MLKCDAVFAIPSSSTGVHLETGIAIERKLPIIIVNIKNDKRLKGSFFVQGFENYTNSFLISIDTTEEIINELKSTKLLHFLKENMLI